MTDAYPYPPYSFYVYEAIACYQSGFHNLAWMNLFKAAEAGEI